MSSTTTPPSPLASDRGKQFDDIFLNFILNVLYITYLLLPLPKEKQKKLSYSNSECRGGRGLGGHVLVIYHSGRQETRRKGGLTIQNFKKIF